MRADVPMSPPTSSISVIELLLSPWQPTNFDRSSSNQVQKPRSNVNDLCGPIVPFSSDIVRLEYSRWSRLAQTWQTKRIIMHASSIWLESIGILCQHIGHASSLFSQWRKHTVQLLVSTTQIVPLACNIRASFVVKKISTNLSMNYTRMFYQLD